MSGKAAALRREFTDLSVSVVDRVVENARGDLKAARATLDSFRITDSAGKPHREGVAEMTESQKVAFMRTVLGAAPGITDELLLTHLRNSKGNVNGALDFLLGPQGPLPPVSPVPEPAPKKAVAKAKKGDPAELARQREEQKAREAAEAARTKARESELEKRVAELQE
jgi:hypothetical protein